MIKRSFFLEKYFLKIDSWAILSGMFGFFFILARAEFETQYIRNVFLLVFLSVLTGGGIVAFFLHGGFRMLFGKPIEYKDVLLINNSILNDHINPNISDEDLKSLFITLKIEGKVISRRSISYSSVIALCSALAVGLAGTSFYNIFIVFLGYIFGTISLSFFSLFLEESFFSDFLKECRTIMRSRGIIPDENAYYGTLKTNFYYIVILFVMIVVVVLSFIPTPSPFLLGLILIGFIIVIVIVRMLFASIFTIFGGFSDFVGELSRKEEKVEYFAGSSYKEVTDLARDLNVSAAKIYEARELEGKALLELQELNKNKTNFILTTEHHLRTPLTIAKGFVEFLIKKPLETKLGEVQDILKKIFIANDRLASLMNDFLSISEMDIKGGAGGLDLKPANIADIAKEAIKEFQSEMDLRRIEAILTFSDRQEDNVLNIDAPKIKNVLINIIDNAVKYNKENGKIFVKGEKITSSDDKIKPIFRLTVEDTGMGILREELPKLFTQYFERSEEAKKIYTTGRGIGLNVVKSIIEAHRGQIFAASLGKDKGSKFIIELPIRQ